MGRGWRGRVGARSKRGVLSTGGASEGTVEGSPDEREVVEILEGRVGGVGVRVVNNPAEDAGRHDEAFIHGAKEVAELQDASTNIATLNLDLRGEYKRPKVAAALEYRRKHHPHTPNGKRMTMLGSSMGSYQNPCGCSGSYDDIIRYGPGISNYFKWLKLLFGMYLVMFVLQLPVILFNYYSGDYFSDIVFPLSSMSLGNLYRIPGNETGGTFVYEMRLPIVCDQLPEGYCTVDSSILLFYYGCADAVTTVVFMMFTVSATYFARRESKRFKTSVLKVEHYSVQVKHVPADATADQISKHFESLLKVKVHDVHLVQTTGNAISLCVKRGRLIKKLARADARRKFYDVSNVSLEKKEKAQRAYESLYAEVEDMDEKASSTATQGNALFAFVTFNTQRDRNRCLEMYNEFSCSFRQAAHLRLGETILKVSEAPPPSTLLWENNEVSPVSRMSRKAVTFLGLIILLVITSTINYVAEPFKVSKNLYDSANAKASVDAICDGKFAGIASIDEAIELALNETEYIVQDGPPVNLLDCLCTSQLSFGARFGNDTQISELFQRDEPCADYFKSRAQDVAVQFGVSFGTLLMNTVIFFALTETGALMKYSSIVKREMTILSRLFVVTYINTGVLILFVNTDLEQLFGFRLEGQAKSIFGLGSFIDFSPDWYSAVGTEIMIVAMLNIFAPHAYPLFLAMFNTLYRNMHHPISQSELDEMFLGPDFVLSYRYSQVLMMSFFIMTYSTGLPVLYAFGVIFTGVTFWVDKYFFTKVCRTPANFSDSIGIWANSVLQYAALIHLGIGIWMLSSPFTFPVNEFESSLGLAAGLAGSAGVPLDDINSQFNNGTVALLGDFGAHLSSRLTRDSTVPAMILFIVILFYRIMLKFSFIVNLLRKAFKVASGLLRCRSKRYETSQAENTLTYQQALDVDDIQGIRSYNILANPTYARAFHLQDETTAKEHTLLEVLQKRATDSDTGLSAAFSANGDGELGSKASSTV